MGHLDWDRLVSERDVWVAHNFPDKDGSRTPLDSVLGCVEELGELTHAHLKQVQKIRGTDSKHEMDARDAIGDLAVYLLGVMSYHNVRPPASTPAQTARMEGADRNLLRLAGAVGHLCLEGDPKSSTDIQKRIDRVVQYLRWYCRDRHWGFEFIVEDTWHRVKQRDWIKYPHTGLPLAGGSFDD